MIPHRSYWLVLLAIIQAFNYADRVSLGVLLQDIKTSLHLSDTELGFLTGIAFAACYAAMGMPIARLADRGNRVSIIALTTAVWSVAVALCGAAVSFIQLLLIRIGVAVGEVGGFPPALSLISDYYPRADRPRAVGRYMLGVPLALVIGNFAAGWLNQLIGWRWTFVVIGAPGLLLAAIAYFSLREPRTSRLPSSSAEPARSVGIGEVIRTLWRNAAFRNLWLCFSVWGFFGNGIQQWQPSFFVRSHGLSTGALGTWLALVYGVGGVVGIWLGAELTSRYARNNERRQLAAVAIVYTLLAILFAGVCLAPTFQWAFAIMAFSAVIDNATSGPLFAATQTLVPPHMRAMAMALIYFFCNLIGMGLGPLAVGAVSDALSPIYGQESLRYALLVFCPGYFWCSWHLWKASRTATQDAYAGESNSEPGDDGVPIAMGKGLHV
jgi:predicted MFS family arabinose efflux permease